jgi:hypothetical protein
MRSRWIALAVMAAVGLWAVGCDTGKKDDPKVNNPNNVQLKPLPSPGAPGGDGGDKKAATGSQGPAAQ